METERKTVSWLSWWMKDMKELDQEILKLGLDRLPIEVEAVEIPGLKGEGETAQTELDVELEDLRQRVEKAKNMFLMEFAPLIWNEPCQRERMIELDMELAALSRRFGEISEPDGGLEGLRLQVNWMTEYKRLARRKEATKRDLAMGKQSSKERKAAKKTKKLLEQYEEWRRNKEKEERNRDPEELTDPYAFRARSYENTWNTIYGSCYGCFEDNTSIPCKRFTFNLTPGCGGRRDALQVFSVKIAELNGGLQWPVSVFGMVALRDSLDHNRNIIFKRERDNCQTLTDKNKYLLLTGPVRGVVLSDFVVFEVLLYVRGTIESDDKELSLLAVSVYSSCTLNSLPFARSYTSCLSTLDLELGHIISSVEATISMKVISGPPDGFCGEFVASTGTIDHEVLLHRSGSEELHLTGDEINLSRSVVSVESHGMLMVSVRASDGSVTLTAKKEFKPLEKGLTTEKLDIADLCQLEVTVAWSLLSYS